MSADGIQITDQYAAGFIDGEGYVGIIEPTPSRLRRFQIAVCNTNFEVIRAIQCHFGGRGTLLEIKPRQSHHLPQLRWMVVYRDALKVAKKLLPYSIVKRENLQKIVDFYQDKSRFHGRAKLTESEASELRVLYGEGISPQELGSRFGITSAQASRIGRGKAWKHLGGESP